MNKGLEEVERLQNEETRKFLDIRNYYEYNNTVDTLNKFVKEIDTQMHPVTTKAYREEIKSAIKNIIENIRININIETLKEKQAEIERLQEENEDLKLEKRSRIIGKYGEIEIHDLIGKTLQEDYVPKDKIREKTKEIQEEYELLLEHQNGQESNRTKYLRGKIHMGQELLEGK